MRYPYTRNTGNEKNFAFALLCKTFFVRELNDRFFFLFYTLGRHCDDVDVFLFSRQFANHGALNQYP